MNNKYINQITCGDAIELINNLDNDSIELVLSDIPYGISLDEWDVLHANTNSALLGSSPAQANKKAFKKRGKPINGWSSADRLILKEYQEWCYSWSSELFPKIKEGGSLFIFGARRTIHRAIIAMEDSGFLLRDLLAWEKPNAHHRAQGISNILEKRGLIKEAKEWQGWKLGNLAPKYEPIAWLFKPYKLTITDNVLKNRLGAMNIDECLVNGKSPTNILKFGFDKNEGGLHEAQKPVALLEYLIRLTTKEGQVVLDPFVGSGSTAVASKNLQRKYIAFEMSDKYCHIAKERVARDIEKKLNNINTSKQEFLFNP
jgi:site-specific DNA-methyltransferase (adenine-specific)